MGQLLLVIEEISEWVVKGFGATLAASEDGLCLSYTWDRQIQLWDFSEFLGPLDSVESSSVMRLWFTSLPQSGGPSLVMSMQCVHNSLQLQIVWYFLMRTEQFISS